jgi:hypothetical protein
VEVALKEGATVMPALTVNIIIVHPRGVVFPRALYTVSISNTN